MKVTVDMDLCQGHSVCMDECPEVFEVVDDDQGYAKVKILVGEPDESLREKVELAVKYCPNRCIKIEE